MPTYQKRPADRVLVEATEIAAVGDKSPSAGNSFPVTLADETTRQVTPTEAETLGRDVQVGDYVVTFENGSSTILAKTVFEAQYELVDED